MKKTLLIMGLFATAQLFGQAVPNGGFESWNSTPYSQPTNWYTSNPQSLAMLDSVNVTQVIGNTSQAVHLHTIIQNGDTDFAYITNTAGDPTIGQGGIPYASQSTGLTGYYRYNLPGNDTALILIIFKKSGTVIGRYVDKIRGTGSQLIWTSFNFTFTPALPMAPDSVIIAAASSNEISNVGVQNGSWLELDQLAFAGPNTAIPDGGFDTWIGYSFDVPAGWAVNSGGNGLPGVTKSTNAKAGAYSVGLLTESGGGGPNPSQITTGKMSINNGPYGGRPYTLMQDTLTGYYEYSTSGVDSGQININLSKNGSSVGGMGYMLKPEATWTYFSIPFSAGTTPDTIRVDITSSSGSSAVAGSQLYVDNVALKSQPLGLFNFNPVIAGVKTYPNPAKDVLNIQMGSKITGTAHVYIYDITGRVVNENNITPGNNLLHINISGLYPGVYFYKINTQNGSFENKFVKE